MREYPKKHQNTTKGLSQWDRGGRDTRTGYGKRPNADQQPMDGKRARTYPKGNSEFQFAKKSQPYERVMKLYDGGYADPSDMAGPEYAGSGGPTAGMSDSMVSDFIGGATNSYGGDNFGSNYGGGGYGASNGGGMRDSNIADASGNYGGNAGGGWGGGDSGQGPGMAGYNTGFEPGYGGNAGAILGEAVAASAQAAPAPDPVRAAIDMAPPTTDAFGRSYSNPTQSYKAPDEVIGPPVSLDRPLPSYNYAQGKFGYALTTPNVPKDQTVLDGLVDIAIEKGLNPEDFTRIGFRESRFNPNARNGQYQGMYQMSAAKAREHGINRSDWRQNATAAADDMAEWSQAFQGKYGRAPTRGEMYLSHQQGETGFARLMENPNMKATEARKSSSAILGNVDSVDRKDAQNWTSQQFIDYWNGNLK